MTNRALLDISVVLAVSVVAFVIESALADSLPWGEEARGVLAVLAGATTAIWLTLRQGGSLADLGFQRPRRWVTVPLWVVGILTVFIVAQAAVPALVAQFFDVPQPDMSRYELIRGNAAMAVLFAIALPLVAAVPEEIIYRGFMIDRFTTLFGGGSNAEWLAALAQALVFGLIHFQWGVGGILSTTIMGLVWGAAFILCGRNLWIVIFAHSAGHVALVMQLYAMPAPG